MSDNDHAPDRITAADQSAAAAATPMIAPEAPTETTDAEARRIDAREPDSAATT